MTGRAVYDVMVATLRRMTPVAATAERARAGSMETWARVLELEGCAAWLGRTTGAPGATVGVPAAVQAGLREERRRSLRNAVVMARQLAELMPVAAAVGARVMVLKGAARLLAGEAAGDRSMADIDLLVGNGAAGALHAALRESLGYATDEPGTPPRHLSALVRPGCLPIEIHRRVSDTGSALDDRLWLDARRVAVGESQVEVPSATGLALHAIEHATVVHRALRFRLRDVIDLAVLVAGDVDADEIRRFAADHAERGAAETLLVAARSVPAAGSRNEVAANRQVVRAWRCIGRVARARLLAPPQPGVPGGSDPRVLVLSQLAEGAPGVAMRLGVRAMLAPRRAARLIAGRWLPIEADRARAAIHPTVAGAAAAPASAPPAATRSRPPAGRGRP